MVRLTVTKTKDDDIDVIPYLDLPFSLVPSMEQLVHLLGPAAACPNRHSLPAGRLAAAALLACTVGETRRPSGSSGPARGRIRLRRLLPRTRVAAGPLLCVLGWRLATRAPANRKSQRTPNVTRKRSRWGDRDRSVSSRP